MKERERQRSFFFFFLQLRIFFERIPFSQRLCDAESGTERAVPLQQASLVASFSFAEIPQLVSRLARPDPPPPPRCTARLAALTIAAIQYRLSP